MAKAAAKPKNIYLISDSTGELGERFTNALITQFPNDSISLTKFNFVEDEAGIAKALGEMHNHNSVLFHTVVSVELKNSIEEKAKKKKLPVFDLTGPPTDFLIRHLKTKPDWNAKAIHPIDDEYLRRVAAIEFTNNHDDGAGFSNLDQADIILIGPSRTSKTPTSIYLATKGFKVANIPITPQVNMMDDFEKIKGDRRVIGFSIMPEKLVEVRLKRKREWGEVPGGYVDLETIHQEIKWAKGIYRKFEWRVIDITDRAIEETAALILKKLKE